MKNAILLLFVLSAYTMPAQERPAYVIYDREGNRQSYQHMFEAGKSQDVILFGELHNDPVMHWLQLQFATDLLAQSRELVLGAEMLESDQQLLINEFVEGLIPASSFLAEARLWKNHKTDYQPLLELARQRKLRFIATNVPRRYASLVYHGGFESLDSIEKEALSWIAPMPIPYDPSIPSYQQMIAMAGGHGGDNLPKAQALKDATMAHFIRKNLEKGQIFLHFNGTYHSDNKEGIAWYLNNKKTDLEIMNIAAIEAADPLQFDPAWKGLGDYILVVPETMTKTH